MKKKVLLMGKSGAGKTSMRSIIFANYIARDTTRLGVTIDVEHAHVRFLGSLVLNLWDCGGQEGFLSNFINNQKDNIFRDVEVLIYVFDMHSFDQKVDLGYYVSCVEALQLKSPNAKIFALLHKMDLILDAEKKRSIFEERMQLIKKNSGQIECTCYPTSIWDETLYKAWAAIVCTLIPNVEKLSHALSSFAEMIDADEVFLFEKATFLVICQCQLREHRDAQRFEKISNIIKQFKLSCSRMAAKFTSIEVRNSKFAAFIESFTSNTYIMVVMSDPSISGAATVLNIKEAKKYFEKLEEAEPQTGLVR